MHLAKQRNGPTGESELWLDFSRLWFKDPPQEKEERETAYQSWGGQK